MKPLPWDGMVTRHLKSGPLLWDWSKLDVYVRSDDNEKETIHGE